MVVDAGTTVQAGSKGIKAYVECGQNNLLDFDTAYVNWVTETDSDPNTANTEESADEYLTLALSQPDWADNESDDFFFYVAIRLSKLPDLDSSYLTTKSIYYSYKDYNQATQSEYS